MRREEMTKRSTHVGAVPCARPVARRRQSTRFETVLCRRKRFGVVTRFWPCGGQRAAARARPYVGSVQGGVVGTMSNTTFRVVTELSDAEIRRLAGILIGVVEAGASVGFMPPFNEEDARSYWRGVIAPDHVLLVAERDGAIVGTAQLELAMRANGRHRAEVGKVLVHPEAQGQGIGLLLLRALEDEARRLGRTTLHLDTREGDPANRLYQKAGYTQAGTIPAWARSTDGTLAGTTFYFKLLA